ncbi:inorganic triphosphatase [Azomonas macrocytogenes]|uniref:Inorganic triphosphatase YgiF n=1 Tax=Azomonas macrocytogenes TaxID=69962 RepID=A0A839T1Z4_AZOMA|nr:CYTH domain-containing protein [Azomonas macrocytogenes]MBB3102640.1 inorganic triphosphatase YgiF [Azomonas macrocytogenes]
MQKETEIKLRATRETLAALREHPLLKKRSKEGWQRHELFNQYYDSNERDLARNKVALRLRRDGDSYIQTLKSRGQSIAGLSERNEWDWHLDQPELDPGKLTDECWPAALAGLDKQLLKPIFSTDFVREKTDIAWGRGKAKVVVEVALDLGKVVAGQQEEEICELELELRQGEPAALLELAAELAADLPLMPCDISKAERGYRLHDAASYALALPVPNLDAAQPLDDAFTALAWHLLGNSQRLAEQYRFNGHWTLLVDWVRHLAQLRALLGSVGQAVPRASSKELRECLDALLGDWRPRSNAGLQDESVRQAAPALFAEELAQPRWGRFSLTASLWLLRRTWGDSRKERGNRLGKAELGKWLPRMLAEEATAMQLPNYQNHINDLPEQLPRMERLLVWLQLARNVLDLPETDRLYGELSKLHDRLEHSGAASEIQAQAQTVYTLKVWREILQ